MSGINKRSFTYSFQYLLSVMVGEYLTSFPGPMSVPSGKTPRNSNRKYVATEGAVEAINSSFA